MKMVVPSKVYGYEAMVLLLNNVLLDILHVD